MRIGLQVFSFKWDGSPDNIGSRLGEIARLADDGGFYSIWVMDHFFQMERYSDPHDPMMESYTTQGFLAGQTKRIKHGVMVTGGFYRHPGLLIKTVNTLDVLSGGRAYFGIGAGWYERESHGLGVPFPPTGERMGRLEEILQIAQHMWRGDESPFNGKYYQLAEPISRPQPLSKPHPPILIGGGGEQKTLRLVAQYGDACNLFAGPERLGELDHKLDVLRQHCADVGRNYDDIEKTTLGGLNLSASQSAQPTIDYLHELAARGVDQAIFNLPSYDLAVIERVGKEIIPAVAALQPS
ncbi:MAG: LLM class F420-dependent oxidoreductase [Anaerolineae bacterium]